MSVHLSQAVIVSKLLDKLSWFIAFLAWRLSLTYPLLCCGKNWISPEIRLLVLSYRTLYGTIQSNSSMHHYECVALCKDISLQRGRFCVRSLAWCIPRSSEDRSSWIFVIQVVRGRPSGRLQFSGGGSKMAWLASAFSSIRARCPNKVRQWVAGW